MKKTTDETSGRKALDAEEEQAIEDVAQHVSGAFRSWLRLQLMIAKRSQAAPASVADPTDLDESAARKVVNATKATFKRAGIEPDYFVGTRPRWRDAESVRAKFAARGKAPTTPDPKPTKAFEDDVDVSSALSGGGLRLVARKSA